MTAAAERHLSATVAVTEASMVALRELSADLTPRLEGLRAAASFALVAKAL